MPTLVKGNPAEDLQQAALQPPPLPWWLGRGTERERQEQQGVQRTLLAFLAYAQGRPESAPDLRVPAGASADERARAYFERSWLYELDAIQIQALYPLIAREPLAQLRRALWIDGLDPTAVRQQTMARFQADLPQLEQWAEVLNSYVTECDRYLAFTNGVFTQFQTYLKWREHHMRKKAKVAGNISKALQVIAEVAQYIPYVGWVIAAAAIATDVGVQVNSMREQIRSLKEVGERVVVLENAVNALESTMATAPQARNLLAEVLLASAIRTEYLKTNGASLPLPANPDGVVARSRGGGRAGTIALVGGGVAAAALALVAVVR